MAEQLDSFLTNMPETERRQFKRVRLLQPIRGSVGRRVIYVLDGSPGGFGVLHRGALPLPGHSCRIVLNLGSGPATADCEVIRTVPHIAHGGRDFFQSGLRIVSADERAKEMLRILFPER